MMVLLVAMFIMLAILSLVYLWLVFKHDDIEFTTSMSRKEHMIAAIVTFLVTVLCIAFCLGGI